MSIKENSIKLWSKKETVLTYKNKFDLFKCEKKIFFKYLNKNSRILDLGCGTGRVSMSLLNYVNYIKGIDISKEMLSIFRKNCPNIDCELKPMEEINEKENSYDVVLIPYNSIDYVYPKDKRLSTFKRIYNSLKKNGVLIFSSHNPMGAFGVWLYSRNPKTWLNSFIKILKGEVFNAEGFYKNNLFHTTVIHYYGSPKQIINDLEKLGFKYLEQIGGNLAIQSPIFNRLFETWIYYVFRK